MAASKRLKLRQPIKWEAIVGDEYHIVNFTLKTYIAAQARDNKKLAWLIDNLQKLYPLGEDENKYKRVRKLINNSANKNPQTPVYDVLIASKDKFSGLPIQVSDALHELKELELPVDKVLTCKQFESVSRQYWPLSFHANKRIESFLDGSYWSSHSTLAFKSDYYSRLALRLAQFYKSNSAAIIVDPRTDCLVATGVEHRHLHPLQHSTMVAIESASKRQLIELSEKNASSDSSESPSNTFVDPLIALVEDLAKQNGQDNSSYFQRDCLLESFNKHLNKDDYLCTNYNVYLTHEPCSMCAMALVHARISSVFYLFNTSEGYLNTKCKLHTISNLNHRYDVFRSVDFHLDNDFSAYFVNSDTKHPKIAQGQTF
jgi:tRNA-specific adenosine deaminase 3